jgi:hypothetical protein
MYTFVYTFCKKQKNLYQYNISEGYKMAETKEFDFQTIVGKKEFEAYQTYIKLTSYENIVVNMQESGVICDDYNSRDFTFPMDLHIT